MGITKSKTVVINCLYNCGKKNLIILILILKNEKDVENIAMMGANFYYYICLVKKSISFYSFDEKHIIPK